MATTRAYIKAKTVHVDIYIDFQKNLFDETMITNPEYQRLKQLAIQGIQHFWSRSIILDKQAYQVTVRVHQRSVNCVDVNLSIYTGKDYSRSHNSGLVDATFVYNKGVFKGYKTLADINFRLISAHEFGHFVLDFFGGIDLSWGHKGSTHVLPQDAKPTTPGYPSAGDIDLMRYYDKNKKNITYNDRYKRTLADQIDVKRLIWLSKVTVK